MCHYSLWNYILTGLFQGFLSPNWPGLSLSLHFLLPEKSKPSRGNNSDTSEKVPKIEVPGGESPFRQTINPLPAPLNPSLAAPRAWERQGKGKCRKGWNLGCPERTGSAHVLLRVQRKRQRSNREKLFPEAPGLLSLSLFFPPPPFFSSPLLLSPQL